MTDLIPAVQAGPTMSSLEIANLIEKRHDSVKLSIERLVYAHIIVQPPLVDEPGTDAQGRHRATSVYLLSKRDSYVVVAQMSPAFTARLVDRWQELENAAPVAVLTGPQLMAAALIEANTTMQAQALQIADMREDVAAFDRIARSDGSMAITDAAKTLGVRPKDLFEYLDRNQWTYRRPGGAQRLGYQSKLMQGLLEHRTATHQTNDGNERTSTQCRITSAGLAKLARIFAEGST